MDAILHKTIVEGYPDLIECVNNIKQINWDRIYNSSATCAALPSKKTKRRKKSSAKKFNQHEKAFLTVQKTLIILGMHINQKEILNEDLLKTKMDAKNYDELITNIKWISKEDCLQFLNALDNLCSKLFSELYDMNGEWTIRKNNIRLLYEMMCLFSDVKDTKVDINTLRKLATEIEKSIMIYTLLMVTEVCNGDLNSIDWKNSLLKSVYLSKSNCILSSLTNKEYNNDLFRVLLNGDIQPLEISFLKRSQILGKFYEDREKEKIKIYEEGGLSKADEDYTKFHSTVRCYKCKLYHTSFTQLQTRSADEPLTTFWYCHKCKIRGKQ